MIIMEEKMIEEWWKIRKSSSLKIGNDEVLFEEKKRNIKYKK